MDKKALFIIIFSIISGAAWLGGCQECDDCGIKYNEPLVNIKFYNIDSLLKVDSTLVIVEDSLEIVNDAIENGDTTLFEIKDQLEQIKSGLEKTQNDILKGKLRIEVVNGIDGLDPLYFRDSISNDSLTIFPLL